LGNTVISPGEVWVGAPAANAFLCSLNSEVATNKNNFLSLLDAILYTVDRKWNAWNKT